MAEHLRHHHRGPWQHPLHPDAVEHDAVLMEQLGVGEQVEMGRAGSRLLGAKLLGEAIPGEPVAQGRGIGKHIARLQAPLRVERRLPFVEDPDAGIAACGEIADELNLVERGHHGHAVGGRCAGDLAHDTPQSIIFIAWTTLRRTRSGLRSPSGIALSGRAASPLNQ